MLSLPSTKALHRNHITAISMETFLAQKHPLLVLSPSKIIDMIGVIPIIPLVPAFVVVY